LLTVHSEIKRTPLPPFGKTSGAAGACEEALTVAVTILYHSKRSVGHYHPFPLGSPHQVTQPDLILSWKMKNIMLKQKIHVWPEMEFTTYKESLLFSARNVNIDYKYISY